METRSVSACRALLSVASLDELPRLIRSLARDERPGVVDAVAQAKRRLARRDAELARLRRLSKMEDDLRARGMTHVAGVDEVGRGALAGPMTAAAVILPAGAIIEGLDDSKKLAPAARERVSSLVFEVATAWHVAHVPADEIDRVGVTAALRSAMRQALAGLGIAPDHVILDGLPMGLGYAETAVVKGDSHVACVAAASVIAKVTRDRLMVESAPEYPAFGFDINKGYGTSEHLEAIAEHGPCPLHRRCYGPCNDAPTLF